MIDRWVLLDYGGVIADDHVAEQENVLAQLFGTDITTVRNAVTERSAQGRAVRLDQVSEEAFWTSVAEEITGQKVLPTDCARLTALWASTCSVKPQIGELLRVLARGGVKLGVATNVDRYREVYMRAAVDTITESLQIFSSWRLGAMKPEASYFDAVTKEIHSLHSAEASILFFDDRQTHVDAAVRAGWTAFRFIDIENFNSHISFHLQQQQIAVG